MANVWVTYSWMDNRTNDVDFVAQELIRQGLTVRLHKWELRAGERLWEQIATFMQEPAKSDAWLIYATQHSLGSEPCREEFAYALDRALAARSKIFPIVALFPGPIEVSLLHPALRTRLCVSVLDPLWKERIRAAAEGRSPQISTTTIEPYQLTVHRLSGSPGFAIEVRPRAGSWSPFVAAIPASEREEEKGPKPSD
jgi:hypothetical protein